MKSNKVSHITTNTKIIQSPIHSGKRLLRKEGELKYVTSVMTAALEQMNTPKTQVFTGSMQFQGTSSQELAIVLAKPVVSFSLFEFQPVRLSSVTPGDPQEYVKIIPELHETLKSKYPQLSQTEITLLLVEKLRDEEFSVKLIQKIWAETFKVPLVGWDQDIGLTAQSVFIHMLNAEKMDLVGVSNFLDVVEKSLSPEYHAAWVSSLSEKLAKELAEDQFESFCKELSISTQGGIKLLLNKELTACPLFKMLIVDKIEKRPKELEEIVDVIKREDLRNLNVWRMALKKIAACSDQKLHEKTWSLWYALSPLANDQEAWLSASELLKSIKPSDSATFFCSQNFATVAGAFAAGSNNLRTFYGNVFNSAKMSNNDFGKILEEQKKYITDNPVLRSEPIFKMINEFVGTCIKTKPETSTNAYGLLQSYVKLDADKNIIGEIHKMLLAGLKPAAQNATAAKGILELLEAFLEASTKYPAIVKEYDVISEDVSKLNVDGCKDFVLKLALKGLLLSAEKDSSIADKVKDEKIGKYFIILESHISQIKDESFLKIFSPLEIEVIKGLCNKIPLEKWLKTKGAQFWKEIALRYLKINEKKGIEIDTVKGVWNLVKVAKDPAKEVTDRLIEMTIAGMPINIEEDRKTVEINHRLIFLETCKELNRTFTDNTISLSSGCENASVKRFADDLVLKLCQNAKSNPDLLDPFLLAACNVVADPHSKNWCANNGTAETLFKYCFEIISECKDPNNLSMDLVDVLLLLLYDVDLRKPVQAVYSKKSDHEIEAILSILHINPLYLINIGHPGSVTISSEKRTQLENVVTHNLVRHEKYMQLFVSMNIGDKQRNLKLKKDIWFLVLKFACTTFSLLPEKIWIVNLNIFIKAIEGLIENGIVKSDGQEHQISLEYMSQVIEVFDDAAKILIPMFILIPQTSNELKKTVMEALFRMAELQINCRKITREKGYAILDPILCLAINYPVESKQLARLYRLYRITAYETHHKYMEYTKPNQPKVMIVSSNQQSTKFVNTENKSRESIKRMFNVLMDVITKEYIKNELLPDDNITNFNALVMAMTMFTVADFKEFKNDDHCLEFLGLFVDFVKISTCFDVVDLFEKIFFLSVYLMTYSNSCSMTEGDTTSYYRILGTLETFLGSGKMENILKAQSQVNSIMEIVFNAYKEVVENPTEFSEELKAKILIELAEFIKNCGQFQYLNEEDYKKWKGEFDML